MAGSRSFSVPIGWWSFRRLLRTIHLWAGLALAIPFILIGLSGSVLILQPEIPRLAMPTAMARGEMKPLQSIFDAGLAAVPQGMRATRLSLPQRRGEPASLRYVPLGRDGGGGNYGGRNIYVDPVSLEILGTGEQRRPAALFGVMRTLHATLYVRTISDRTLIGCLGIAMVLLSLTGLVLWWPRKGKWKSAFIVRRGSTGFRLNHDLHAAFGIWTLLLFLIVGISGVYLAFPRTFRAAVGTVLPLGYNFADAVEPLATAPGTQVLDLDETVTLGRKVVPRAEPLTFQLPGRPDEITVVTFAPQGYGMGAPPILISVDRAGRQIVYVDDPRTYAAGERVVVWQRLLHSGLGLGVAYKVLVFLSGLLPLLFAITGFRMWWLKRAQRRYTVIDAAVPQSAE